MATKIGLLEVPLSLLDKRCSYGRSAMLGLFNWGNLSISISHSNLLAHAKKQITEWNHSVTFLVQCKLYYSDKQPVLYVIELTYKTGRGERIRTSDSCVPNAVLYQAELHPELLL